jgi:signal peptide peptidase SppA
MTFQRNFRSVLARVAGRAMLLLPVHAGAPVTIEPTPAKVDLDFMADLRAFCSADHEQEISRELARRAEVAAAYGYPNYTVAGEKPFLFIDGVAIIPVQGTLINRFSYSYGTYVTGYNFIQQQLAAAMADPEVTSVIFDCNSYGGQVSGCFELADYIYSQRGVKPMAAIVDSACCSAAFALMSACDKIYATPSSWIGSVGVVSMHADYSEMLADVGIKVTFVFAGAHKADRNPYNVLSDAVKADMQAEIDKIYDSFVSLVARNRNMDASTVRGTEAQIYAADDALKVGFINATYSPPQALSSFLSDDDADIGPDDDSNEEDEPAMDKTEKTTNTTTATAPESTLTAADVARISAEAARNALAEDRARRNGILTCAEAKDKPRLAAVLAEQDMSIDAAKVILGAAASEAAPVVTAPVITDAGLDPDRFQRAMDRSEHPNITADPHGGVKGDTPEAVAARMLRNQQVAGGGKVKLVAA